MASIRASGGLASGRLRKVDPSQKRDRSAATVSGGTDGGAAPGRAPTANVMAGTLTAVLERRKMRVSQNRE